jgi:hypothetical protein
MSETPKAIQDLLDELEASRRSIRCTGGRHGSNQGTLPLAITPAGVIMGLYRDAKNLSHGFLFRP